MRQSSLAQQAQHSAGCTHCAGISQCYCTQIIDDIFIYLHLVFGLINGEMPLYPKASTLSSNICHPVIASHFYGVFQTNHPVSMPYPFDHFQAAFGHVHGWSQIGVSRNWPLERDQAGKAMGNPINLVSKGTSSPTISHISVFECHVMSSGKDIFELGYFLKANSWVCGSSKLQFLGPWVPAPWFRSQHGVLDTKKHPAWRWRQSHRQWAYLGHRLDHPGSRKVNRIANQQAL